MFKSKKYFNEITSWIKLECDYEHPLETAKNVYQLFNSVYKYFDHFDDDHFKEDIDANLLKSVVNKVEENIKNLQYKETLIRSMNKEYKNHYKISQDAAIPSYAIPTDSFQITLSELIIMYRTLKFCAKYPQKLKEHFFLPWNEPNYYYNIKQIQESLSSRLGYALLNSINSDKY